MEPSPGAASDADARASAAAAAAALQREHLSLLEKEVKRVAKKRVRSATETLAHVDAMLADVRRAQASLEDAADAADARVCVDAFRDMMRRTNYPSRVSPRAEHAKALLACVGKLGKAIAVSFDDPETCQGPRWDVPLDDRLVLDAVACHYYRTGKADLADAAAAAARFGAGAEAAATRSSATAASAAQRMAAKAGALERDETRRFVLDGIRKRDVRPLLDWIGKNAVAIETAEAAGRLSPFFGDALPFAPFREPVRGRVSLQLELFAHRAAIGAALERGDAGEAARRARASLELASGVEPGARASQLDFFIEKLARALRSAPFATGPGALARPESAREEKTLTAMAGENGEWWCDLADRFEQLLFRVSRFEPRESPLLLAANAGCVATPTLSKLAGTLAKTPLGEDGKTRSLADFRETLRETQAEDDDRDDNVDNVASLPVELPLPPSFAFGSTFACPVRRDAVFDEDEPIMMLPCGVLISKGGIDALTPRKPGSAPADATFKCINCSRETKPNECKRVFF